MYTSKKYVKQAERLLDRAEESQVSHITAKFTAMAQVCATLALAATIKESTKPKGDKR